VKYFLKDWQIFGESDISTTFLFYCIIVFSMKKDPIDHEHDLFHRHNEHIDEEWEEEHPAWTWIKRIFLFLISLFLIYLMFTYMGIGPDVLRVFEGQAASERIDGNYTLYIDNSTKVVFTEELYGNLFDVYLGNQEHEFKACLYGDIVEEAGITAYQLDRVGIPTIYEQDVYHVASAGCDAQTLVSMHSHPYKKCLFSTQDISSYESFLEIAPDALLAIMCEEDRFSFYR
jgi:proteasome lid subunit RPN8/RPN11